MEQYGEEQYMFFSGWIQSVQ